MYIKRPCVGHLFYEWQIRGLVIQISKNREVAKNWGWLIWWHDPYWK